MKQVVYPRLSTPRAAQWSQHRLWGHATIERYQGSSRRNCARQFERRDVISIGPEILRCYGDIPRSTLHSQGLSESSQVVDAIPFCRVFQSDMEAPWPLPSGKTDQCGGGQSARDPSIEPELESASRNSCALCNLRRGGSGEALEQRGWSSARWKHRDRRAMRFAPSSSPPSLFVPSSQGQFLPLPSHAHFASRRRRRLGSRSRVANSITPLSCAPLFALAALISSWTSCATSTPRCFAPTPASQLHT